MKKLINTIFLSIFMTSSVSANTIQEALVAFEQETIEEVLEEMSYNQPKAQSEKEVNINQKLENIEKLLKYLVLEHKYLVLEHEYLGLEHKTMNY